MRPLLLIPLALLMLTGCDIFFPREKHPERICTEPQPIYDDADGTRVLAWVIVCYTVWRTPGIDPASLEGDADVEYSDSTRTVVPR